MNEIVQQEKEQSKPHKIGWGERIFYGVSVLLWIADSVLEDVLEKVTLTTLFIVIDIVVMAFVWFIFLGLGSFLLKKAINKKGITSPYQGSLFLLLLRSDLIGSFFANLSSMLILGAALPPFAPYAPTKNLNS